MIAVLTLVKLDCEFDNIFRITTHERESSSKKCARFVCIRHEDSKIDFLFENSLIVIQGIKY